jgi:hypothetical protein
MITQAGGLSSSKEVVRLRRLVLPFILAFGFQIMLMGWLGQPVRGDAPQIPASSVRCVNPGGTGGCYASIQAAINAANYGDLINVAVGVYHERITMKNEVSIHGQGWLSTTIHGDYSAAEPTVNISAGVSASTVLSGVQITGGGNGSTTGDGGGIAIWYASPSIVNTSVYSCTAERGGGVMVFGGAPSFNNVLIWNNRAQYGGGLYLDYAVVNMAGDFTDFNGTIWFNSATHNGGGIFTREVTATLSGLRVWWNSADQGGGVYIIANPHRTTFTLNDISGNSAKSEGGGLGIYGGAGQLEIIGNLIRENTATYGGGGVVFGDAAGLFQWNIVNGNRAGSSGGGVLLFSASPGLTLGGNWFEANSAGQGGGLYLQTGAAPRVEANTIVSNTASLGGGFFLQQAGPAMIVNNIVARNVATAPLATGGIQINESPARIINNTLAENKNDGVWFTAAGGVVVVNNIIYGHTGDGIERYNDTASYTVGYNDLFGNGRAYVGLPPGAHDLALNPQFVAAGSDLGAYYHIQATSPVSATGEVAWAPPLDIDGEVRNSDGKVSMGADELPVYPIYLPLIWRKS